MTTLTKTLPTLSVLALAVLSARGAAAEPQPGGNPSQRVAVFMGFYRPT